MPAGELRERLAFDRRGVASDGYGNHEGEWGEEFVVYARVRPLKGGEAVLSQRLEGIQPVVITVRRSSRTRGITAGWRARDLRSEAVYAITAPPADMQERGAYLDILASFGPAP